MKFAMKLLTAICMILPSLCVGAQDDHDVQVLVFRNTGEVNLFYAGHLSSVEMVESENDSQMLMQRFMVDGEAVDIPLAEIDSVAIGSRNAIKPKANVRRLTEEEAGAVRSYDGALITYPEGTSSSLIPRNGELIYYDRFTDVFPYGLCGVVKSQSAGSDGSIVVEFEEKSASELFDDYFYAGSGDEASESTFGAKSPRDENQHILKGELPEIELGPVKVNGSVEIPVLFRCTNVVTDLKNHYYHATLSLHLQALLKISASVGTTQKCLKETDVLLRARFISPGHMLSATIDGSLFIELAAELGFRYEFENDIYFEIDWERKDGKDTFSEPRFSRRWGKKESKREAFFDGKMFFGPKFDIEVGALFDRVGAGVSLRVGPEIKAEFSRGFMRQLAEKYDEGLYSKAQLDFSLKGDMSTYWFNHEYIGIFGFKTKHMLPFKAECEFYKEELNLFPSFHTRAAVGKANEFETDKKGETNAVTIATVTDSSIEYPLNIGFELASSDTDKEFCRSIEDNSENMMSEYSQSPQVFVDQLVPDCDFDKIDFDTIVARPVFRYDGLIIKAAPNVVGHGQFMSPVTYAAARSGNYIVSGMPMVSIASENETTFIEGNLLPIAPSANDEIYSVWTAAIHPVFITVGGDETSLIGTWRGEVSGKPVELTFEDDGSGSYNGKPFTYMVNTPRQGRVGLRFETGESMAFIVTDLTKETLTFVFNNSMKKHILKK